MMKLLIVAASGGLGSRVVFEALSRGHSVSVLVRSQAKLEEVINSNTLSKLKVFIGDATNKIVLEKAVFGNDAIISCGPSLPEMTRTLGEVCKASSSCKKVLITAGASNILEIDGKSHHLRFGPQGNNFYNYHQPAIDALKATGATFTIWCPGLMKSGNKSLKEVQISNRAIVDGYKSQDFITYEDAANVLIRAVESTDYDNEHIAAISDIKNLDL
jgi:uncharacterized protein